jgi:hypothetical protein
MSAVARAPRPFTEGLVDKFCGWYLARVAAAGD